MTDIRGGRRRQHGLLADFPLDAPTELAIRVFLLIISIGGVRVDQELTAPFRGSDDDDCPDESSSWNARPGGYRELKSAKARGSRPRPSGLSAAQGRDLLLPLQSANRIFDL